VSANGSATNLKNAVAAQCTLFSKSIATNWLVPLHQDLSIPVAERVDSGRCSGWSEKEGELFVQPPVQVLEQVLALRLHLDDCDERNGALRVVPGSHLLGRLDATKGQLERDRRGSICINVSRGSSHPARCPRACAGDLQRDDTLLI
jgi:ectoine hydroxylase-related dioxygenase (phytanoyl-CoA dioxygenase family)